MRNTHWLPERMFLKLKFVETDQLTIANTINAGTVLAYRGNSIYDPNAAVGGISPYGYDQLATLYGRYRVHGSKIYCSAIQIGGSQGSTNDNGFKLIYTNQSSTTIVDGKTIDQMPRSTCRWAPTFHRGAPIRTRGYGNVQRTYGVSKQVANTNAEFTAAIGADPASQWYHLVTFKKIDDTINSAASLGIHYRVVIIYYVCLYDRKWLAESA